MKISLITPLYNKAPYIEETIRSVLTQTHSDWEMIIVDNGSTDGSQEVVKRKLAVVSTEEREKIQFIEYDQKKGPGAARNFGLKHATCEWVLFLDADDLIEPNHLECLVNSHVKHPDADIIAGGWKEFSGNSGEETKECRPAGEGQDQSFLRDYTIANAPWAVHAAIIKRKLLQTPYQWVEELDQLPSEDTAFWFRLLTSAKVTYADSAGALYRLGLAESRNVFDDVKVWFPAMKSIIDDNVTFLGSMGLSLSAGQCEYIMRRYSDLFLKARRFRGRVIAREALQLADHWLKECSRRNGLKTKALIIRRLLGLKLFLQFQR